MGNSAPKLAPDEECYCNDTSTRKIQRDDYVHILTRLTKVTDRRMAARDFRGTFRQLDNYTFHAFIGSGHMSRVYTAGRSGGICAVKCIPKTSRSFIMTAREYLLLAVATHSNVPLVFHAINTPSAYCLDLEYMPFQNMEKMLKQVKKIEEPVTIFYAAQLVLAIEYLQSFGVVHNEVVPCNVLIDIRGYIKLADFAMICYLPSFPDCINRTPLDHGMRGYIPPEVLAPVPHTSVGIDWFCLGVFIYEMITNRSLFPSGNLASGLDHIYPMVVRGRIQHACQNLIFELTKADPWDRLGTRLDGAEDVRHHVWFRNINWGLLYRQKYVAPMPPLFRETKAPGPTELRDLFGKNPPKYADISK